VGERRTRESSFDPLPPGMLMAADDVGIPQDGRGLVVDLVRTVTVVVVGSIDRENVVTVVAGIDRAAATAELVVLDLSAVPTIDVTGLRAIAAARRAYGDRLQLGRTSTALDAAISEHAPQPARACSYRQGDAGGPAVHR
jgi:ABC-type transporter Mla MlaB component